MYKNLFEFQDVPKPHVFDISDVLDGWMLVDSDCKDIRFRIYSSNLGVPTDLTYPHEPVTMQSPPIAATDEWT